MASRMLEERFVKRFQGGMLKSVEEEINEFLVDNPTYKIVTMTYMHQGLTYGALVYFEKI